MYSIVSKFLYTNSFLVINRKLIIHLFCSLNLVSNYKVSCVDNHVIILIKNTYYAVKVCVKIEVGLILSNLIEVTKHSVDRMVVTIGDIMGWDIKK